MLTFLPGGKNVIAMLTLQVPDPDLLALRLVAATRDPAAVRAFRQAVMRAYRRAVQEARSPGARALARQKLSEMKERLDLVLDNGGPTAGASRFPSAGRARGRSSDPRAESYDLFA
jgi:hypothetical protein